MSCIMSQFYSPIYVPSSILVFVYASEDFVERWGRSRTKKSVNQQMLDRHW